MGKEVVLRNTSEKFAYLRETLDITTKELAGDKVTEKFIRMVERQKRNMSKETAIEVMMNVINFANEKGIYLDLDEEYLARSKEDDLCEICDKLDNTLENRDIFNKIIDYAEENNYPWAKIIATKKIGNVLFINKKFNEAYEIYLSCLNMIDRLKSNRYKEAVYTSIGNIKLKKMQYEEALIYYKEALNYCYLNRKFKIINSIKYNIAMSYYNLDEFNNSLKEIEEISKDDVQTILSYNTVILKGINYIKLNMLEEALCLYKTFLKDKEVPDDFKSIIYNNMALIYMYKNDCKIANMYSGLASLCAEKIPTVKYKVIVDKGHISRKFKQYKEAKTLLIEGLSIVESFNDCQYQLRYLKELYFLYEEENNDIDMKKIIWDILRLAKCRKFNEEMIWARKKLIDIAIKENDLSILKSV